MKTYILIKHAGVEISIASNDDKLPEIVDIIKTALQGCGFTESQIKSAFK